MTAAVRGFMTITSGICLLLLTYLAAPVICWTPSIPKLQRSLLRSTLPIAMASTASDVATGSTRSTSTAECSDKAKERFQGQSVLLTGASGGLGRSLALQLSECGVGTLVMSGRNQESLEKVAEECRQDNDALDIKIFTCDLGDAESVKKLGIDVLEAVPGGIDVLINNGGVSSRYRFLDTKFEVDELVMRINFLSGASLAKAVVPGMVKNKKGAIIWISSVQGLVGIPNRTSYAASKFAVQGYCEALRGELASSGVTVHVASPGYIRTNLSRSAIKGDGEKHGKMDETTANGADPNDVAVSILDSVASGKADFVVATSTSAKAAIWLRLLAPSFLNSMLAKRYEKSLENPE